jgi:hypothetical protein
MVLPERGDLMERMGILPFTWQLHTQIGVHTRFKQLSAALEQYQKALRII